MPSAVETQYRIEYNKKNKGEKMNGSEKRGIQNDEDFRLIFADFEANVCPKARLLFRDWRVSGPQSDLL